MFTSTFIFKNLLIFFKSGFFKDDWEPRFLRLYPDSTLEIYDNREDKKANDRIFMKDIADFLAVGQFTKNVPGHPKLPKKSNPDLLIAFPKNLERDKDDIIWLMPSSMDVLK